MQDEDSDPSRIQKIKQHLKDNKRTYLVGAGCLAAGYFLRPKVVNIVDVCNLKYKSPVTNIVTTELARRGHPGYLVRCLETGEIFASKNRAAQMMGINRYELFKHLKGFADSAGGYTFEILGEAA